MRSPAGLVFIQMGLTGIAEAVRRSSTSPVRSDVGELHRRYLWLMLDALRVHPHEASPLPVPALTSGQTQRLLAGRAAQPAG
ncbi:hypothetical protein [uncultured Microbacterium sp.]|uniref:hypothetical protein n=1 Tax=uncultured Microbacterium sp. TaxID=191216 RepID=UPI0028D28EB6|nr:hypothetical protein [uncultured Microbacterium sp.]